MKKNISILFVAILILSGIHAIAVSQDDYHHEMSEQVSFSKLTIIQEDEYMELSIEESDMNLIRENKPLVPMVCKMFTFPFGTTIDDVTVSFQETIQQTLKCKVIPSPAISYISTEIPFEKDDGTIDYSKIDVYPAHKFDYTLGSGFYHGEHVILLNLNIYPVQYYPNSDKISYTPQATIDVTYTLPKDNVLAIDEYDFLVLSPTEFSDELQPLIDYKNNDGISTILKTLDEIPDVGYDQPESIKLFIKDAIEQWGIDYVLLVGGWVEDSNNQPVSEYAKFPIRKAYIPSGNYESWFPSDLYYADIYDEYANFSTWDDDGDGKYAEMTSFSNDLPAMDLYPDVAIGRIPCISEKEVTDMVEKIIQYEEHNKMTNKIVQIGGDTFPGDPQEINEGEYANVQVLNNLGDYESIRLWASKSEGAKTLSKGNIANGFNTNVDFVDFSGHGSYASWATHAPNDESTWLPAKSLFSPYTGWLYIDYDLFFVNNKEKHPVVVFNACSCSKFSESHQCLSWTSIHGERGGIASFGASGIGYGSYGTSETDRVWGWMEVHIFKGIYNDKILGDVWSNCQTEYTSNFVNDDADISDFKTIVEMTLFGDPTLAIEDGIEPRSHSLEKSSLIDIIEQFVQTYDLKELISNFFTLINP
jgi:hypothetical protein